VEFIVEAFDVFEGRDDLLQVVVLFTCILDTGKKTAIA
jgi:hypothetical protein